MEGRSLRQDGDARVAAAAETALGGMATGGDAIAPLIRNAWYVISASRNVDRVLRGIKVIGEPLVYYRTEAGQPVVLDDRCAHRRFPLSKSKLVGDGIQCGYHGFTYDSAGACTYAPGVSVRPGFRVRQYAAVEKGAWLWVWMGDAATADPADIPLDDSDGGLWDPNRGPWHTVDGHVLNPANYMVLIENLLDITHLHFLHGPHVQDRAYAESPPKSIAAPANGVAFRKAVPQTAASLFASWCGGDPAQMVHEVDTVVQTGPSLNQALQERSPLGAGEPPIRPERVRITHCLTPADERTTHQFWQHGYSSPLVVDPASIIDLVENVVFAEDVAAVGYVQDMIENDRRTGAVESGIPSDRFGITMRKVLREMKAREA